MFWLGLLIGLVLGGVAGVVVLGMLVSGRERCGYIIPPAGPPRGGQ